MWGRFVWSSFKGCEETYKKFVLCIKFPLRGISLNVANSTSGLLEMKFLCLFALFPQQNLPIWHKNILKSILWTKGNENFSKKFFIL